MPSAMWESAQLAMRWEWEELGRSVSKNRCVSTSACLGEMFSGCTLTLLMLKSACTDTCSWYCFVATCWHLSACPEHPEEISSCSYNSAGAEEHWGCLCNPRQLPALQNRQLSLQVVPGGGSSSVCISFTPHVLPEPVAEVRCEGFVLGFMSLDDKVSRVLQQG